MTLTSAAEASAGAPVAPEASPDPQVDGAVERSRRRHLIGVTVVATVLPLLFWWFENDDAVITFAYARAWGRGGMLGVPATGVPLVEGYSNFGWLLLLSLGAALGISVVVTAKVLGALAIGATTWMLARTLGRARGRLATWCCLPTTGIVIWAASGLENAPRDLLLVGLGLALHRQVTRPPGGRVDARWIAWASGCAVGLLLMRPDAFVPVVVASLVLFRGAWRSPRGDRRARWAEAAVYLVAVAGSFWLLAAWRTAHFGWPWPNTVYAKSPPDGFVAELRDLLQPNSFGWWLWRRYLLGTGLLLLLPAAFRGGRRAVAAGYGGLMLLLATPALLAVAAPDWMADGRFFTSGCWLLVWAAAWGVARQRRPEGEAASRLQRAWPVAIAATVLIGLLLDAEYGVSRWRDDLRHQVTRAETMANASRFVAAADDEGLVHPLAFTPDAGAVLFDVDRIWLLDAAYLNDPILSHVKDDLEAQTAYVFELQRPELIEVPSWAHLRLIASDERLVSHGYHRTNQPARPLWARRSAGAIAPDDATVLVRLADPATPVCDLPVLARALQQRTAAHLPPQAPAIARSLAARRGSEASFAAFVLDPTEPSYQKALVGALAAHQWSECPPQAVIAEG